MTEINPTDIIEYHEEHRAVYDYIEERLHRTREAIIDADPGVRSTALFLADVYSIISLSTTVGAHERAFSAVIEAGIPQNQDRLSELLSAVSDENNMTVQYYNDKARYIVYAMEQVDYDRQAELFAQRKWDELHRFKYDNVKGLASAKAGFSLEICGVTEKFCIDSVLAGAFGYTYDRFQGVIPSTYEERAQPMRDIGTLGDEVCPVRWQWATWDAVRSDSPTMHDPWFQGLQVGTELQID
jgi:hypothetical protein